ncbi:MULTISPECIES: hypothetical protein [Streptomyces]|uniref:Putative integral membrane protein n=1 Tax=Streptomyces albus (strain ATCC 21838 / DSM 41398 / FERM P-419 / JCM 4703 / NBRC 107858) TaxID=1081613 RepID=A0A0B5EGG7_STRA4|nr:hypothetical protein [Streptomyces sp. SCSIO ZS0520]AJE81218.1 putative integral membrane protein [Streptomyces albus]AOU75533.1 putative integral membrane protein [Streptomyces albus]AYN31337.1 hypothetical protein DUI70_0834 [Streptomyces albus]
MSRIEWVRISTGARSVPEPVANPVVWAAASTGALILVAVLNHLVGLRPALALLVLSLFAAVLGLCSRMDAAPGTALLCWLFLNGFAIPPAGTLTWTASRDSAWLTCLLLSAVVGTALARIVNARAAYRRVGPGERF